MLKILLVIGVIAFVYYFFIKKKPLINSHKKDDTKLQSNDMIECSTCGVYCEFDEAILSNGKYYCSTECVEKG
ncbi:uncharacterized protein SAMN06313486_1116 [Epsilonproteobacteria bacterium SCGC AD-308-P11]|jgi:uncharacterized protein|nr:uncharacterized protein SAMN06313486_1116 [Epsilonproteobacteria bacterium SCGC AD-308-P11]